MRNLASVQCMSEWKITFIWEYIWKWLYCVSQRKWALMNVGILINSVFKEKTGSSFDIFYFFFTFDFFFHLINLIQFCNFNCVSCAFKHLTWKLQKWSWSLRFKRHFIFQTYIKIAKQCDNLCHLFKNHFKGIELDTIFVGMFTYSL